MNLALTASFNSWRNEQTHLAFDCPTHDSSTNKHQKHNMRYRSQSWTGKILGRHYLPKKLFPRSPSSTLDPSTIVILPIPPRTRFFRVSEPVGPQLSKHILAFSKAACPCSPHILPHNHHNLFTLYPKKQCNYNKHASNPSHPNPPLKFIARTTKWNPTFIKNSSNYHDPFTIFPQHHRNSKLDQTNFISTKLEAEFQLIFRKNKINEPARSGII